MEHDIFNILEIQDLTYKSQWWNSEWFKEWLKLAGKDFSNYPKK